MQQFSMSCRCGLLNSVAYPANRRCGVRNTNPVLCSSNAWAVLAARPLRGLPLTA
jgi:hypothetical protein